MPRAKPQHGTQSKYGFYSLVLAVPLCFAMLYAWFPWQSLLRQQSELGQINAAVATLHEQKAALEQQSSSLDNPETVLALARQEYQLVQPGQRLVQILPSAKPGANALSAGDPANDPLASPTDVINLNPHQSASTTTRHGSSFWSRFLRTVEFWR